MEGALAEACRWAHATVLRCCGRPAGIVNNWEEMQHVWDHTFRERLKIDPKECSILLTGAWQRPAAHLAWRAHAYRARQTRR